MFHAVSVFYCNKRVGSPFDDPLPLELDKHKKMLQTIEFLFPELYLQLVNKIFNADSILKETH